MNETKSPRQETPWVFDAKCVVLKGDKMNKIMFGCQTYPWKMGRRFAGEVPHMLDVAASAGFQSLEAEMDMLGSYFDRPQELKRLLDDRHMSLAALVLHQDWEGSSQNEEEKALSRKAVDFLKYFPFAKLMMSHHAGDQARGEGEKLETRRKNLIACMQEAACEAAEAGIVSCFHPNSAKNSLFVTPEDYEKLFELLAPTSIGWAPDVGHLVNGGNDALALMKKHRQLIRHVHYKDRSADGIWTVMGDGDIDYPAITRFLYETGYRGWVMVEDEGALAAADSDAVVCLDGAYMCELIRQL